MFVGHARQGFALFQAFRVLEAQVQFLLQRVRVLVAADAHVARKQRDAAANDVDVHHARADIQQRHRLACIRFVVDFKAILQTERIDVHDHRRFACLRQHVRVIQNLVFLHRHQQHVHLRVHGLQQLITQIHVRDVERNVLARFGRNPVVQLFFGHQRKRNPLHNHRVSGNRSRDVLRLDVFVVEDAADRVGDLRRIHDRAVHHRILGQRFHAEADQFVAGFRRFQFDRFNRTRTDIEPDQLPASFTAK